MKKNLLKNERGELSYFSVFVILAVNMLLSFLLLFASVKINCINIRNDDVFRSKVRYLLDRRDPSAADPASDMRGINMGADQLVR
jgi:hypothetical protein